MASFCGLMLTLVASVGYGPDGSAAGDRVDVSVLRRGDSQRCSSASSGEPVPQVTQLLGSLRVGDVYVQIGVGHYALRVADGGSGAKPPSPVEDAVPAPANVWMLPVMSTTRILLFEVSAI